MHFNKFFSVLGLAGYQVIWSPFATVEKTNTVYYVVHGVGP